MAQRHEMFDTPPNDWYRRFGWNMVRALESAQTSACSERASLLRGYLSHWQIVDNSPELGSVGA